MCRFRPGSLSCPDSACTPWPRRPDDLLPSILYQDHPTDEIQYYDMLTLEPWHDESCRLEIPAGAGSKPRSFTLFTLLKMLAEYQGSSAKHSANEACIRRLL